MKPKLLLTLGSIWIALIGLLMLITPAAGWYLDEGTSALAMKNLHVPASLYFGLVVVNWFARNAEASKARDAIFLGNTVGFGLWAILAALTVLTPGANPVGWGIVTINLVFAIAFFVVGRANMSTNAS